MDLSSVDQFAVCAARSPYLPLSLSLYAPFSQLADGYADGKIAQLLTPYSYSRANCHISQWAASRVSSRYADHGDTQWIECFLLLLLSLPCRIHPILLHPLLPCRNIPGMSMPCHALPYHSFLLVRDPLTDWTSLLTDCDHSSGYLVRIIPNLILRSGSLGSEHKATICPLSTPTCYLRAYKQFARSHNISIHDMQFHFTRTLSETG